MYGSALGTQVLRHQLTPRRPISLDGAVTVINAPEEAEEALLYEVLSPHGDLTATCTQLLPDRQAQRLYND